MLNNNGEKLRLNDIAYMFDVKEALFVMSDGIPGAIVAMGEICKNHALIDPDSALGPYGVLAHLDQMGVYGSRIWVFYKDLCGADPCKVIGLLRGSQLGLTSDEALVKAIDGARQCVADGLNIEELLAGVKKRLPQFITDKGNL